MNCPQCKKESVYMRLDGGKQEYFCTHCKLYFAVEVDPDSIEFEDIEFDDSECDYGGY